MIIKLAVGTAVVVGMLFVAAAGGWWFFVREDARLATNAPEIPQELVQESSDVSDVTGTGSMTFQVIPEQSEAAYFADEELARLSVPSTAKGATNAIEGAFYLSADGWELDTTQASSFTVDLTGLSSGESRRDSRVQEALETSAYPTATFTVTSISGVDTSVAADEEHTFTMTGILDLHGIQKEVTWEVKAMREGNVLTALATTNFVYEDFRIPVLNVGGFVSVEDDVTLQVQIVAMAA
jgi:polyisoprenoid-binding protein YceI